MNDIGQEALDRDVKNISFDSRQAEEGDIFVALKGTGADGHDYLPALADKNLAAIVCERMPEQLEKFGETPLLQVRDSHEALGVISSSFFGNPSEKLCLIGVTGTNGKTTVATLIYEMSRLEGVKSGLLSTIANYIDGEKVPSTHTTPDAVAINRLLKQMVDRGCKVVAMEVSSHASHQKRIAGLRFAGGIFTNLTRDHLDYHKTFADYRDAKKMFFDNLDKTAFALTNIDDPNGEFMLQNTKAGKFTYSLRTKADFEGRIIDSRIDGSLITLNGTELETLFAGKFNIYNLTAVYGALVLSGFDKEEAVVGISGLHPVAGRFQSIKSAEGKFAIIDYAHTPDALKNVLDTLRETSRSGEIITVVGAGGDRDRGKRPEMGKIAASFSDKVIFTSDNPRNEDPDMIIADIKEGLTDIMHACTFTVPDRREAIKMAVALAKPGDIILIAGKGHENYQEVCGVRHHFSDKEEVERLFNLI